MDKESAEGHYVRRGFYAETQNPPVSSTPGLGWSEGGLSIQRYGTHFSPSCQGQGDRVDSGPPILTWGSVRCRLMRAAVKTGEKYAANRE